MRFILAFVLVFTLSASMVNAAPNFVLFIADDYSWHDAGPYGAKDVHTPNLDRLAREGMTFNYAFAPSATCTPSRSAIYTGLYPFRNGAHTNHSLVNDGVRTLPQYFHDLGYRVVLAGKTHIGPRPSFPFEYLENSNIMPPGKNELLWTDLNTAAVDKLLAEHDKRKPLCLVVCSHSPHVYWLDDNGYDPAQITLPPYLLDTPETRAMRCKYYTDVSWMDQQVGEVLESLTKHGFAEQTLFAFTADQGAQWPFAKWNLYDAGIRVPLIVRWPGHIQPGARTNALVTLIDLIPTMTEAAGAKAQTEIDGRSFLPVLTGKSDRHLDAIFAAHTGDKEMNHAPMRCIRTDQYKYIINLAPEIRYTTHISDAGSRDGKIYWDSWEKLAMTEPHARQVVGHYRHREPEELFDVQADPYELKNLATDPARAMVLAELRQRVRQWRLQQGEDLSKVPMPEDGRMGEILYAR
jgi:arylsulfatase A-like enzyme